MLNQFSPRVLLFLKQSWFQDSWDSKHSKIICLAVVILMTFHTGCENSNSETLQSNAEKSGNLPPRSNTPSDSNPERPEDDQKAIPDDPSNKGLDQLSVLAIPANDQRSVEAILCTNGPKIIADAKRADFSRELAVICEGSKMTAAMQEALANTYRGVGEPFVKILKRETNKILVTDLYIIFGFRTDLPNPTHLTRLKLHDQLAAIIAVNKISKKRSELSVKVSNRQLFPAGSISVESLNLNYNLNLASDASIYDIRDTEINNYGLSDTRKEVALGTEHLLNASNNEYYHDMKGLMISISVESGTTDVVFMNHLIIKNRIDPIRLESTLLDLNQVVSQKLYDYVKSASIE